MAVICGVLPDISKVIGGVEYSHKFHFYEGELATSVRIREVPRKCHKSSAESEELYCGGSDYSDSNLAWHDVTRDS